MSAINPNLFRRYNPSASIQTFATGSVQVSPSTVESPTGGYIKVDDARLLAAALRDSTHWIATVATTEQFHHVPAGGKFSGSETYRSAMQLIDQFLKQAGGF